jgi:carboxypeptidase PM20D1
MIKVLKITFAFILSFIGILFIKSLLYTSKQLEVKPVSLEIIDLNKAITRLSQAIPIQTISYQDAKPKREEILKFHKFLESSYPLVFEKLKKNIINEYSILLKWEGTDPNLLPILLMAHLDVVPIEDESAWQRPPFSGYVDEEFIWGRGTLDDKVAVISNLEAIEHLLKKGFQPKRTIYLSIGHDEETLGTGAGAISKYFKEQGTEFEFIQDEGMFIADGFIPGIKKPVAIIGLAQKGYVTVQLTVEGSGGHSSAPPSVTPVGILSKALVKLEENPMPGKLDGLILEMFNSIGPEMSYPLKLVFANSWLLSPIIESQLSSSPGTNANLRTTTAITMVKGSEKENILPQRATALVNFRIHPSDNIQKVLDHVTKTIQDPRVKVSYLKETAREPSPISPTNSKAYENLTKTIKEVFPDTLVAPGLFIASSDTFNFVSLSKNIFRFHPLYLKASEHDEARIHGANERIPIKNYEKYIQYVIRLIQNTSI